MRKEDRDELYLIKDFLEGLELCEMLTSEDIALASKAIEAINKMVKE